LNGNGDEMGDSENLVDMADYQLWKDNFGNFLPPEGGGGLANIPEPTAGFLLAVAAFSILGNRRCNRRYICSE
jgi:hypothetical protein